MSEQSQREKDFTFKQIREEWNSEIVTTIENCKKLSKMVDMPFTDMPNIMITYNNKLVSLEKQFLKAGIDFYNSLHCESRFVIQFELQGIIISAQNCISSYVSSLTISKEQYDDFVNSFKKPSLFDQVFKGKKYAPKNSLLTPEQKADAKSFMNKYIELNDYIQNFSVKDNIAEALQLYKVFALANGVTDSDLEKRFEKIAYEISLID